MSSKQEAPPSPLQSWQEETLCLQFALGPDTCMTF